MASHTSLVEGWYVGTGAYLRVEHLKGASRGQANIRLGWRGLPGTNTLAYCENPLITAVKSFIVHSQAVNA
jgi:hypothetical protein